MPTQFTKPPLLGLWHQHYFAPRFAPQNIVSQLGGKGVEVLARQYFDPSNTGIVGENADWEGGVQSVTTQQFEERFEQGRLTGEWIVFEKHAGKNFYLALAVHTTGPGDLALFDEIKLTCSPQFPFSAELKS